MLYKKVLACEGDLHDCFYHAAERDCLETFTHYLKALYRIPDGQIGVSTSQRVSLRLPVERGVPRKLHPIISCWVKHSSNHSGLYVGCSQTNIIFSYEIKNWRDYLPALNMPYEEKGNQWFFSYLDKKGIDELFKGIERIRDGAAV